jgi:hypothetical protein
MSSVQQMDTCDVMCGGRTDTQVGIQHNLAARGQTLTFQQKNQLVPAHLLQTAVWLNVQDTWVDRSSSVAA